MYNAMKRLIERKFYKTSEDAQVKLDVFFAVGRLTVDEYTELTELVATTYGENADSDGGLL
jgi:hypothetical protein